MTFPEYEGRGIAAEMARQLVQVAQQADPTLTVTAQTLPRQSASTAILRKQGFAFEGEVQDPEEGLLWQWTRTPSPSP